MSSMKAKEKEHTSRKDKRKDKQAKQLQKQRQQKRRKALFEALKPLLWAFVAWFAVNAIVHLPGIRDVFSHYVLMFTSHTAYWFGKVFFIPIEMPGSNLLKISGFTMRVVMECTAYTYYLFALALITFARWPLGHKLISLAIILPSIFVANNLRFITMGYVGRHWPDHFHVIHDIAWNVLFGFMVFGLWAWRELKSKTIASK